MYDLAQGWMRRRWSSRTQLAAKLGWWAGCSFCPGRSFTHCRKRLFPVRRSPSSVRQTLDRSRLVSPCNAVLSAVYADLPRQRCGTVGSIKTVGNETSTVILPVSFPSRVRKNSWVPPTYNPTQSPQRLGDGALSLLRLWVGPWGGTQACPSAKLHASTAHLVTDLRTPGQWSSLTKAALPMPRSRARAPPAEVVS